MALYEVIGKSRKVSHLVPPQPQQPPKAAETAPVAQPQPKTALRWPAKPDVAQVNRGRIEMSLPYSVAIILALGVIAIVLAAFRIGQGRLTPAPTGPGQSTQSVEPVKQADVSVIGAPPAEIVRPQTPVAALAAPKGDNCIVITQYVNARDLKPVQEHFARFGIETVIENTANRYFLVTKDLYENPLKSGTDGSVALAKIVEVGAKYKAQQGYESFRPNLFSDAYGRKVK
jgi:hypothetical protein